MTCKQKDQNWKRWLSPSAIILFVLVAMAAKAGFWTSLS